MNFPGFIIFLLNYWALVMYALLSGLCHHWFSNCNLMSAGTKCNHSFVIWHIWNHFQPILIGFESQITFWKMFIISSMQWSYQLSYWDLLIYICIKKLGIIGLSNGLEPGSHQTITWTYNDIVLHRLLITWYLNWNVNSVQKMHFDMSSTKFQPFCPGVSEFIVLAIKSHS